MSQPRARTAVVTGGGQGIGLQICQTLAQAGFKVAILDINAETAQRAESTVRESGAEVKAYCADISRSKDLEDTFLQIEKDLGPISVLINNAAMFSNLDRKPFEQISDEEWQKVMQVNINGAFFASKAAVAQMKKIGWGRIINISSNTVDLGRPFFLHYVTSKSALVGMTRSMARELGTFGITTNVIMPSLTRTNVATEVVNEAIFEQIAAMQCIPRSGEPRDVANAIKFLVSEDASFITGQTIAVDGGAVFK